MKHLLLTTIAVVLLVTGCSPLDFVPTPLDFVDPIDIGEQVVESLTESDSGESQQPTAKAPDIPIHEAAKRRNIEAVKQHLAAGTDVSAKDGSGRTPLHYAANGGHKEIVELLIAKGADVNAKTNGGWTPLHYAVTGDQKEIAELLIAAGADVNVKQKVGGTPLDRAIKKNHTETADLLLKHGGKTGEELKAEGK